MGRTPPRITATPEVIAATQAFTCAARDSLASRRRSTGGDGAAATRASEMAASYCRPPSNSSASASSGSRSQTRWWGRRRYVSSPGSFGPRRRLEEQSFRKEPTSPCTHPLTPIHPARAQRAPQKRAQLRHPHHPICRRDSEQSSVAAIASMRRDTRPQTSCVASTNEIRPGRLD